MTYEVKPGTVAYKAVAYLQTLPAGEEVITSKLAESVFEAPANMTPALLDALEHGAIFRRQKDARHSKSPYFWSLTDYEAAKKKNGSNGHNGAEHLDIPTTDDIGAGFVEQSALGRELVKAWTTGARPESLAVQEQIKYVQAKVTEARKQEQILDSQDSQHVLKAEAARLDATDRENPGIQGPRGGAMGAWQPAAAGPMRMALWSDGTLQIQRGGSEMVLSPQETQQLVEYIGFAHRACSGAST